MPGFTGYFLKGKTHDLHLQSVQSAPCLAVCPHRHSWHGQFLCHPMLGQHLACKPRHEYVHTEISNTEWGRCINGRIEKSLCYRSRSYFLAKISTRVSNQNLIITWTNLSYLNFSTTALSSTTTVRPAEHYLYNCETR